MDAFGELEQIARSEDGDFHPLILLGFAITQHRGTDVVSIRTVADETLLRTLLTAPFGRRWLSDALDRLCDATRPPDDQPRDVRIKHFVVRSTDPPHNGIGFPR